MISTGITGTLRQLVTPKSASRARVKTLLWAAPPRVRIASRARRIWSALDECADHLQGEIGFDAGTHVELAVMKQRPPAMITLDALQIGRDLCLKRRIWGLAEIMGEQHIFSRYRGVGLEFEHPVSLRLLALDQGCCGRLDALLELGAPGTDVGFHFCAVEWHILRHSLHPRACPIQRSAARLPERIAPSMVAGSPFASSRLQASDCSIVLRKKAVWHSRSAERQK